jgi:hypothetical protein
MGPSVALACDAQFRAGWPQDGNVVDDVDDVDALEHVEGFERFGTYQVTGLSETTT